MRAGCLLPPRSVGSPRTNTEYSSPVSPSLPPPLKVPLHEKKICENSPFEGIDSSLGRRLGALATAGEFRNNADGSEQDRPDVRQAREEYRHAATKKRLETAQAAPLDETWTSSAMTRRDRRPGATARSKAAIRPVESHRPSWPTHLRRHDGSRRHSVVGAPSDELAASLSTTRSRH